MPNYDLARNLTIPGWMTEAELRWLHRTASRMSSVVEIGSWKGRSTFALLSGCPGVVWAIDHWRGSEGEGLGEASVEQAAGEDVLAQFEANVGHFPNLSYLRTSSETAAKDDLRGEMFDMVFIDGSHRYLDV